MGGNSANKKVLIVFDGEFYANLKRSAELLNMSFSNFIRMAASDKAYEVLKRHEPDKTFNLSNWEMYGGGDYSSARAKKDENYKKRKNTEEEGHG